MCMVSRGNEGRITGFHGNMGICRGSNDGLEFPCSFLNMWTLKVVQEKKERKRDMVIGSIFR